MQQFSLKSGDPLVLTLASDSRLSRTDYLNDHIWELNLGEGEPSALSIDTTYGLRARSMRVFPIFVFSDRTIINPKEFASEVQIIKNYPNFIRLTLNPVKDVDAIIEYWVPESQQIAGKMTLINLSKDVLTAKIAWAAILTPSETGERMSPTEFGAVTVLTGRTENLAPLLFMTGGLIGDSGPYPCLAKDLVMDPNTNHRLTWVLATKNDHDASFENARLTASRNWIGTSALIDQTNASTLEIITGELDWNSAFQMAKKVAFGSIMEASDQLNHSSYVSNRMPDQGYSKRGDGSDYDYLWNGQTPLETYFLIDHFLPAHEKFARGLLENFLDTQTSNGYVDWKPGLNGHRSQLLATPILACIALKLYRSNNDITYLRSIYPKLMAFFLSWFDESHDRDQDRIPEWDHILQTGFEDNPLFAYWNEWSKGVDISKIESPDLSAFLYRECQSLIEISTILDNDDSLENLRITANRLSDAVKNSWNDTNKCYQYRDRDIHTLTNEQLIGERAGPGVILVDLNFNDPLRLNIILHAREDLPYSLQLFIHGTTQSGTHRIEKLSMDSFQWQLRRGYATSDQVYKSIDHINIQGIGEQDHIKIDSIALDTQNQTSFLPLWAGIPSRKRAKILIKKTISDPNRFWKRYGVRAVAFPPNIDDELNTCNSINIIWNALLIEGILNYGYRSFAAELFTHNMTAIIQTLKDDHAFRRLYHADSGKGIGEKNVIGRLAPTGIFLLILGVHVVSEKRIILDGFNPFPWPVTIKYRGLTIIRQKRNSMIIFPDGNNITIRNGKSQIITLE